MAVPRQRTEENLARFAAIAEEPCSACGAGPRWRIARIGSDVMYSCWECGHRAFRVPFKSRSYARKYMRQIAAAGAEP